MQRSEEELRKLYHPGGTKECICFKGKILIGRDMVANCQCPCHRRKR